MVNERDAVITGIALIMSTIFIFTVGGVELPGTESLDDLENILFGGVPEVNPDDKWKITHTMKLTDDTARPGFPFVSFDYQTSKSSGPILSYGSQNFSLIDPIRDVEVEYVLRESETGRIVATDSKYIGDLEGVESVTFETPGLVSGDYDINYKVFFESKSLFGVSDNVETLEKNDVRVPKAVN